MERFWRAAGVALGKYWKWVIAGLMLVTVLLGLGATRIEFATGQDSYLNPDSQTAIDNREYQSYFGGETVILLFSANRDGVDVSDLFEGENLATLQSINDGLREIPEVEACITPLISVTFSDALIQQRAEAAPSGDETPTTESCGSAVTPTALGAPTPTPGPGGAALLAAPARDESGAEARNADVSISLARRDAIPLEQRQIGEPAWNELLIYGNDNFTVSTLR